jgi:malonate decarboxylase gamma subunit
LIDSIPDGKRTIVAVVDVSSQAYGRREEAFGIHGIGGAAGAYAEARQAGHAVIALIVGKAMSGAFLAHGCQANRIIALNDSGVMVHAMGKAAAARHHAQPDDLERLAADVPPDGLRHRQLRHLGLLWRSLAVGNADRPSDADVSSVRRALTAALDNIRSDPTVDLRSRLGGPNRQASSLVREKLLAQW